MDDFAINQIDKKLRKVLNRSNIKYGSIKFLNESSTQTIGSELDSNQNLVEIILESEDGYFPNNGYFPKNVEMCLGIPIFVLGKVVGIVVSGGNRAQIYAPETHEAFDNFIELVSSYILRDQIKRRSLKEWGQEIIIIGDDPRFLDTLSTLQQFVFSEQPVQITGESGVGKEIFARSIYLMGKRYEKPYVSVNCAQFQDEYLLISELFGHKKGSFTGAISDKKGVFETANGGVIMLDEIGELSLTAQKMLLRVIEYGEIRSLGAERTIKVDTQILSATHQSLEKMIIHGDFREDLYYRLNVLPLHIPPLRERGKDYLLLVDYFLNKLNKERGVEKHFSAEALDFFGNYSFPGNVRELKNIVETGFWLSSSSTIELKDITTKLRRMRSRRKSDIYSPEVSEYYKSMVEDGKDFWEVIRKPFLDRDLNRKQVTSIIREGMKKAGSYKELLPLFNIKEKDYKKFLNFLNQHRLKP